MDACIFPRDCPAGDPALPAGRASYIGFCRLPDRTIHKKDGIGNGLEFYCLEYVFSGKNDAAGFPGVCPDLPGIMEGDPAGMSVSCGGETVFE